MAVTLEQFKSIARIDYNQDDAELQLYLDGAVEFIENYTNHSLKEKTVTYVSNGCAKKFYGSPIVSITGATSTFYHDLHVVINANLGDTVTIQLGDSDKSILKAAVYSLATTMYESKEVETMTLPVDLQGKINKFRRGGFLS